MGVCSVHFNGQTIALSPRRFLESNTVFKDIADHYFGGRSDLVVFSEVNLRKIGNFDFVMVKHKPFSSEIEDFVIIELQTAQTTSTGKLVKALESFLRGENIEEETFGFSLNYADIWKRTFTQILNKGIVVEHWGNRIYWVIQEPIYQDFLNRYRLDVRYSDKHNIVFAIYDLRQDKSRYELVQSRIESATTSELFAAFSNNPDIPSKDAFAGKLKDKLAAKLHLKMRLDEE
jgi:hypothetical protein